MELRNNQTLQTTRSELARLTFATLSLLIAGLITSPVFERAERPRSAENVRQAKLAKTKKSQKRERKTERSMAQFTFRR